MSAKADRKEIEALSEQWLRAERELERLGFRRCDVAACNCGGYHQHRPTVIEASLAAQVESLKKDRDYWREQHERRRGEALAALMVERAAQDRAERVTEACSALRAALEDLIYKPPDVSKDRDGLADKIRAALAKHNAIGEGP